MTIQLVATTQNSRLDAFETAVGTAPKLQIRTGAQPATCELGDSGTLLNEITLPTDWMSAASGGVKEKLGTWQANCVAAGTAGHFRLKDSAGTVTHMQGSCGQGSGDLQFDNAVLALNQSVTISQFDLSEGND